MARTVLVADDSPTIQKRAMGILKGEGFDVETVSNGVAAIKRLALLHPLVILADVSMPGRDGYEVCEYVKKSPALCHAAVLLVASDMEPYDHLRGAEVGADGIIKKPFDAHELASTVAKFADQFEAATAVIAPPAEPPASSEPPQEFAAAGEEADYTPTVVQPGAPDFSSSPHGVALFEPGVEHSEFASEAAYGEMAQSFAETPMIPPVASPDSTAPLHNPFFDAVDELPTPAAFEPEPAPRGPSFLETMGAVAHDPVFDGQSNQDSEPSASSSEARTMIFRTPAEIADSLWNDPAVPAAPASEPAGSAAAETAVPALTAEPPGEQPIVAPQPTQTVTATSFDSFSLDDAAHGPVQFTSQVGEIAIQPASFASLDEFTDASFDQPPPAPELTAIGPTDSASHELSLDQTAEFVIDELPTASFGQAEPAADFAAAEPSAISLDALSIEQTAATVRFDELPTASLQAPEPVPDPAATGAGSVATSDDQIAAVELPETVQAEGSAAESAADAAAPETAATQFTPEAIPAANTAPMPEPITPADASSTAVVESLGAVEAASVEPVWDGAQTAPLGALEAVAEPLLGDSTPAQSAPAATAAETGEFSVESASGYPFAPGFVPQEAHAESVPAVAASVQAETSPPEPSAAQEDEAAPGGLPALESAAGQAAPALAYDLELIHAIVRKVTAKMAPPILSPEVLEDITSRLANEIAAEMVPPPDRR